ncbi:hypothetical protein IEO21_00454 [Rhodonia placenta]|uniref:Uncharacterized protein n=1 Tax=Rhodonia placenta TaxID=104341 RepID=A0A8H7PBQ3_9APHY|nr:hypothetical protein IEO21_00454 [Postia placenta]
MAGPNLHLNSTLGCFFVGTLFSLMRCKPLRVHLCADALLLQEISWRQRLYKGVISSTLRWFYVLSHEVEAEPVASFCGIISFNVTATFVGICSLLGCDSFFINTIWRRFDRDTLLDLAVCSVVGFAYSSSVQYIAESAADMKISAFVYVPSVLASDAFITATLCWILHGKRTGFRQTEMLLTKLIVYSANRGLTNLQKQGDRPPAFLANDTHSRNTDQAEGSDQIYGENIEIRDVV